MASVWSEHFTKEGRVYYYNKVTKQSSWTKPTDYDGTKSNTEDGKINNNAIGVVEWEELWDPKNQRHYYYNRQAKKTQWLKPENVTIKPYAGPVGNTTNVETTSTIAKSKEIKKRDSPYISRNNSIDDKNSGTTDVDTDQINTEVEKHPKTTLNEEKEVEQDQETSIHTQDSVDSTDAHKMEENGEMEHSSQEKMMEEEKKVSKNDKNEQLDKKSKKRKAKKEKLNGDMSTGSLHRKRRHTHKHSEEDVPLEKRLIICDTENDEELNNQDMVTKDLKESSNIEDSGNYDRMDAMRVLAELSKPDAIMETNVLSLINSFLRAQSEDGKDGPEKIVEKLVASYRGHAQMIGLVGSWLDSVPVKSTNVMNESKLAYDKSKPTALQAKVPIGGSAEVLIVDSVKDLIKQHYDPRRLSDVLSDSVAEPQWITDMLKHKKWRMMLIELAEIHKSCTLLQYAIQRISEAGHHKEIASISTADAFFPVFNGVLIDSFRRILFANEEDVQKDLKPLTKICCNSAYSYIYATELLHTLDAKLFNMQKHSSGVAQIDNDNNESGQIAPNNVHRLVRSKLNLIRLQLQDTAIEQFGEKAKIYHPLKRLPHSNHKFASAILSTIGSKSVSVEALEILAEEYRANGDSIVPQPVAHLRDPVVLRSLLDPLFNPSVTISPKALNNCIYLLAYATSTKDERSIWSILDESNNDIKKDAMLVEIDETKIEKTKAALANASAVCKSDSTLGYNMNHLGVVKNLSSLMEIPVVSAGVLHWLSVILKQSSFVNSTLLHLCFPSLLRLLKVSISLHPSQWPMAFNVLVISIRLHPDINPVKALELKRESLRCMVYMVTSGYVLPVLEFIYANTQKLDQALLRNFISELVSEIGSPYSESFMKALLRILLQPKVQEAIAAASQESKRALKHFYLYSKRKLPQEYLVEINLNSLLEEAGG